MRRRPAPFLFGAGWTNDVLLAAGWTNEVLFAAGWINEVVSVQGRKGRRWWMLWEVVREKIPV